MASNVDTRNKRASVVGLLGYSLAPVMPDGTLSVEDLWAVAYCYAITSTPWEKTKGGSSVWVKSSSTVGTWSKTAVVGSDTWTKVNR